VRRRKDHHYSHNRHILRHMFPRKYIYLSTFACPFPLGSIVGVPPSLPHLHTCAQARQGALSCESRTHFDPTLALSLISCPDGSTIVNDTVDILLLGPDAAKLPQAAAQPPA